MLEELISDLCIQHSYLEQSKAVNVADLARFQKLRDVTSKKSELKNSLYTIMRMQHAHFGKPVILLIDEYDVPLAKSSEFI